MKKTALLLATCLSVQILLALFMGATAEAQTVLTFKEHKESLSLGEMVSLPSLEEEKSVMTTLDQYLTGGVVNSMLNQMDDLTGENKPEEPSLPQDENDDETDVVPEDTVTDQQPENDTSLEDKGFAGSAEIDTTTPILQRPSGTIVQGYVAPSKYKLTATERDLVERVVMQEVSGRSYVDALAVAQTIYDRSVDWGYTVTYTINMPNQFANPTYRWEPTAIVKQAVSDVFDKGYRLTEEKMYYYYATRTAKPLCFHETQRCLVETKLHRYFGPWED